MEHDSSLYKMYHEYDNYVSFGQTTNWSILQRRQYIHAQKGNSQHFLPEKKELILIL